LPCIVKHLSILNIFCTTWEAGKLLYKSLARAQYSLNREIFSVIRQGAPLQSAGQYWTSPQRLQLYSTWNIGYFVSCKTHRDTFVLGNWVPL